MNRERLVAALSDRYQIERELGAGGMATVYLAEDVKHHRKVAIKLLHAELSAVLGPERFLKEIELTANLQHPHILPLFDSGSADGLLYYVMPFVEGETLRARLERERQLPVADATRIATEVADALQYAHERGVIHRDIKPENVLLQNGHALVADFGIAIAVEQAGGARMTQTGLSLGTPQYMSPEQAMGERSVDARTDIYALSAVTYEMLAGEPPFTGPNAQAILAHVITGQPRPLGELREMVSSALEDAVHTALAKLPADRHSSAAQFAAALAMPSESRFEGRRRRATAGSGSPRHAWREWRAWSVAGVVLASLALGAIAGRLLRGPPPAAVAASVRFAIIPDSGYELGRFAIAPDGSAIAYWAFRPDSSAELRVRRIDQLDARRVAVVPRGADPNAWRDVFFSADAKWVGFMADGVIEKVPASGGAPVLVARAPNAGGGAAWADDGTIFYADGAGGIVRVPPDGGQPERVLAAQGFLRFVAPSPLPGSRGLLLSVASTTSDEIRWTVLALATGKIGTVYPGANATYVEPGAVVTTDASGKLWLQAFDVDQLAPEGLARALPQSAGPESVSGRSVFAASRNGTIIFRSGGDLTSNNMTRASHLMLVDREGQGRTIASLPFSWAPRLSPDGSRLALGGGTTTADAADVWVLSLAAGTTQRITTDSSDNNDAQWSPDGRSLVYSSKRDSSPKDLYVQPADGSGAPRLLVRLPGVQWSSDWSRDGRWILFTNVAPDGTSDIWVVPAVGDTARPLVATPFSERGGRFSPDGHWVAYASTETGQWEVYIQPFPAPGAKIAVSVDGAYNPVWSHDGRELYYWTGDRLVAAQLSWEAGRPRVTGHETLFELPYVPGAHANFDVTADGQRFVVLVGDKPGNRIVVELNSIGAAP